MLWENCAEIYMWPKEIYAMNRWNSCCLFSWTFKFQRNKREMSVYLDFRTKRNTIRFTVTCWLFSGDVTFAWFNLWRYHNFDTEMIILFKRHLPRLVPQPVRAKTHRSMSPGGVVTYANNVFSRIPVYTSDFKWITGPLRRRVVGVIVKSYVNQVFLFSRARTLLLRSR